MLSAGKVKGKGGVFKLTAGLQTEFGSDRVFNSPLAEANIVGRAVGYGDARHQAGRRDPVLRLHLARRAPDAQRARRSCAGAPTGLGVPRRDSRAHRRLSHRRRHLSLADRAKASSPTPPASASSIPSNALDANGLLRTAIRCDDPVLFLEHKRLYRETYGRAPYPGPDYAIPFGKAAKSCAPGATSRSSPTARWCRARCRPPTKPTASTASMSRFIDLRTLSPYDWDAIAESVRKTSRVIVAHEDMLSWGYGAEIAARIADELFDDLDAPVRRVAAMDTFVAYQPILEDAILPQPEDLYREIVELTRF